MSGSEHPQTTAGSDPVWHVALALHLEGATIGFPLFEIPSEPGQVDLPAASAVIAGLGFDAGRLELISFGEADGARLCALADALGIRRVVIARYAEVADASEEVGYLGDGLDDHRLVAEYGRLSGRTADRIPFEETALTEAYADARFHGHSEQLTVRVLRPGIDHVREQFLTASSKRPGAVSGDTEIELVNLHFRRYRRAVAVEADRAHLNCVDGWTASTRADGTTMLAKV